MLVKMLEPLRMVSMLWVAGMPPNKQAWTDSYVLSGAARW